MNRAGRLRRCGTWVLDSVLVGVLVMTVVCIRIWLSGKSGDLSHAVSTMHRFRFFVWPVGMLLYFGLWEGVFKTSPGKWLMGTRVISPGKDETSFSPIGFTQSLVRTLGRCIPFDPVSYIGGGRGWHDRIAGTDVMLAERESAGAFLRRAGLAFVGGILAVALALILQREFSDSASVTLAADLSAKIRTARTSEISDREADLIRNQVVDLSFELMNTPRHEPGRPWLSSGLHLKDRILIRLLDEMMKDGQLTRSEYDQWIQYRQARDRIDAAQLGTMKKGKNAEGL